MFNLQINLPPSVVVLPIYSIQLANAIWRAASPLRKELPVSTVFLSADAVIRD